MNDNIYFRAVFLLIFSLFPCLNVVSQNSLPLTESQGTFAFTADGHLLDHPLFFYGGLNLQYTRMFYQKGVHQIGYSPSLGFVKVPDVETRWLTGIGVQYKATILKRIAVGADLSTFYVLSYLAYKRYEYDKSENFVNKGRLLHHVAPAVGVFTGFDVFRIMDYKLGLVFQTRLIRFDKSYTGNMLEGYKPVFSMGITLKH